MIIAACVIAALVVLLYPQPKPPTSSLLTAAVMPPPASVATPKPGSFREAVDALAVVRGRLVATEKLDESAAKAIDIITLALVSGSDK